MLIGLGYIVKAIMTHLGAYTQAILGPVVVVIITLAGIVMIFGAVGMGISANLGSTVVRGVFRAIGFVGRRIFRALGWIVRNTFRMIPRVFNWSMRTFNNMGVNAALSNALAVGVVILFLAIII